MRDGVWDVMVVVKVSVNPQGNNVDQCDIMYECIYQNEFKQGALVHFEELLVPYRNVICPLLLVLIILRWWGIIFVMSAPLNHLGNTNAHTYQFNQLQWS